MSSPLAGVAVVNAITFGVHGQVQRQIPNPDSLSSHFIAGTLAGIAQTPICGPMELAKTRMQLSSTRFSGPLDCLKHMHKYEGNRGMFRGLGITLLRDAPSFGIYFLTYESLTRTSGNECLSTPYMLLAGGLAGTASWTLTYPLDVVKSRIQANSNRYTGVLDCFKQSVKAEGYSCMYRGLSSTIVRAFPTNAVTFTMVTWTFRLFGHEANETSKSESKTETIESVEMGSETRKPFIEKWNTFLKEVSESVTIPALSTVSDNVTSFENTILYRANRWLQTSIKYDVAEHVRTDTSHEEDEE
ncbi:mitochondrial basic amino acids transporter isoform X2 [Ptiloglossa arizonensis]